MGRSLLVIATMATIATVLAGAGSGLAEPVSPITSLRFSPDGRRLAVAGGGGVRIFVPGADTPNAVFESRLAQVFDAAWSPDGHTLAIAGGSAAVSGAIELWDLDTRRVRAGVRLFPDLVYAVAYSPDGALLAAAGAEGLKLLEGRTAETRLSLAGHSGPVLAIAWSPDGKLLASGSADRSIRLWQPDTGALLRTLNNHAGAVEALQFAPDGQTLFSASSDATVRVWVPVIGRMKRIFRGFGRPVLGLSYAPARNLLVAAVADGTARLVNAETGEIVKSLEGESGGRAPWLQAVAVSPEATWIAVADAAGHLRISRFPPTVPPTVPR